MKLLRLTKGFTLIEILVVITIIGILVAVLVANFSDARIDTKNKALMAEFKEVQLALELYKAQHGHYPPGSCDVADSTLHYARSGGAGCSPYYIDDLVPEYISSLPSHEDAARDECTITYFTLEAEEPTPSSYKLIGYRCLGGISDEPGSTEGMQSDDELARCASTCGDTKCTTNNHNKRTTIAVYSPGGACW